MLQEPYIVFLLIEITNIQNNHLFKVNLCKNKPK